jgi:hypothetical protein
MTPAELDRWSRDYARKLDHRIALDKIKRDSDAWLANYRDKQAQLRRGEESLSKRVIEDRLRTARLKAQREGRGVPIDVARRAHDLRLEQSGVVLAADRPFIELWRRDVAAEARRLGVEIIWEPKCAGINAYAWPALKRVEGAPITSAGLYITMKHELGHNACPCEKSHTRSKTDDGSCCVRCEIRAWQWSIDRAVPQFTAAMHARLARSLPTYRKYGTPNEQREIDDLVSGIGFRQAQLRRAGR